jgi:hypothetical protein
VTPQAAAVILSRLGFATDETDAAAIVATAVSLGATPDEGRDALILWGHLRHGDVVSLGGDAA